MNFELAIEFRFPFSQIFHFQFAGLTIFLNATFIAICCVRDGLVLIMSISKAPFCPNDTLSSVWFRLTCILIERLKRNEMETYFVTERVDCEKDRNFWSFCLAVQSRVTDEVRRWCLSRNNQWYNLQWIDTLFRKWMKKKQLRALPADLIHG